MEKVRLEKKQEISVIDLLQREYTFRVTGGFMFLCMMINFLILINVLMIICS